MNRLATLTLLAAIPIGTTCGTARSQTYATNSTGSVGCAAINQAAANGLTARVGADDASINPPKSVTTMTCLNNFFSGTGLNLVTNLLDPATLLKTIEGQICNAVNQEWTSLLGTAQCGLTLNGFNFGFGGLGGGLSCPKLSFGGSGPPVGGIAVGTSAGDPGTGLYINGSGMAPTGYTTPTVPPGIL